MSFHFARVITAPDAVIPTRHTARSAGYDFAAYLTVPTTVPPDQQVVLRTGIKAYMPPDWVLLLIARSSVGIKRHLMIPNCLGVIDADYADNPDNDGEIFLALYNMGPESQVITPGERLAQGIFVPFGRVDEEPPSQLRRGGIGSTGF